MDEVDQARKFARRLGDLHAAPGLIVLTVRAGHRAAFMRPTHATPFRLLVPAYLCLSQWRPLCTLAGPQLTRWHAALEQNAPAELCVPPGFGGQPEVRALAWHGDKILGAAVAAQLAGGTSEHGDLSLVYSAASSNEHMARHLDELLPPSLLGLVPAEQRDNSVHDCGTMVEACVKCVADAGDTAAIDQLAGFLVRHALDDAGEQGGTVPVPPKNRLLELGGTVSSTRCGGEEHMPIFEAVARLDDRTARAQGASKKVAERDACEAVLAEAGRRTSVKPRKRVPLAAQSGAAQPRAALTWAPVRFREEDRAANLLDGEDLQSWFRRKRGLHRCVCAPAVYPDTIRSVDAWRGQLDGGHLFMLRVCDTAGNERLFLSPETAATATAAIRGASRLAHAHILELVADVDSE